MERQTAEVQDKMSQLHEEQSQLDRDLEESQSERNTKYRELRKREETMDQVQGHNNMQNIFTSFQRPKLPQTKMHTTSDIIFGHSL